MTDGLYAAEADPYCYPGTSILRNIPGLRSQASLDDFEAVATMQRADEPLPEGRLSVRHYRALHHHLFQDIYPWAGKFRTVRIGKDGSAFCYPEHIAREMKSLFAGLVTSGYFRGVPKPNFAAGAAEFLSTLNAIHPFREGNGRAQTLFLALLASRAGHPLHFDRLQAESFLHAMIASFKGEHQALIDQVSDLIA